MADVDDWVAPSAAPQDSGADDWVQGRQPSFIEGQERTVGNMVRGAAAGSHQGWEQLKSDFVAPLDKSQQIGGVDLAGLSRLGRLGLDAGSIVGGFVSGITAPAVVPAATRLGEEAGLSHEEAQERAETLNEQLPNVAFGAEGGLRGPRAPEVVPQRFAPVAEKSVYTSPVPANPVLTGQMGDLVATHSPIGPVLDAFSEGPRTNWGIKDLTADFDTAAAPADVLKPLTQSYADVTKSFNEAFQRSAASSALVQAGPSITEQLAAARNLGVIGEGEAGWMGIAQPGEADIAARTEAGGLLPAEPAPLPDIHERARQIAPDVFEGPNGYDALATRQDTFRRWIDELSQKRDEDFAANPPLKDQIGTTQGKIDAILGKVGGVEDKLTKTKAAQLDDLRDQLDDLRDQSAKMARQDTPDMQRVRQVLLENDYKMRDMAEQVSAAYRRARSDLPPEEAPPVAQEAPQAISAPVEPEPAPAEPAAPEVAAQAVPEPVAEQPKPGPVAPSRPAPANVAADVSQKLVAAGRPVEEADAAGQLIAAHYDARAARFDGALGTGPELYAREAPEVRAGRVRQAVREKEFAQTARGKIAFRDAQATITLMKDANASTFIHETGHQWLEEMMRDAGHDLARGDLKTDAKTVRDYLGVKDGEDITTRQHEKFARSFERYMMEGTAPSKGLADVFAKFKNWLTQIYETVAKLRAPINDDIRQVFDRLLTKPGEEAVIAPEREPSGTFADLHEDDALHTQPEHSDPVRDTVEQEIDQLAERKTPDIAPDLANGSETGELTAPAEGDTERSGPTGPDSRTIGNLEGPGKVSDGGGNAGPEGAAAREQPRATAYYTVPKEPKRLIQWIKEQGGIRDDGGDVSTIMGGSKGRPGLISKKGVDSDTLAHQAWQAGYLPEFTERPTAKDLFEAIERDAHDRPVYSDANRREAEAHSEAVRANAEIDRIAAELGIDPKGMTRQQFMDAVAEHMSVEDQAKWVAEHTDALDQELQDAIKHAQDELGDSWEGLPTEYDVGQPRTLEDLENDAAESSRAAAGPGDVGEIPANVRAPETEVSSGDREGGSAGTGAGQSGSENGEGSGPAGGNAAPDERLTRSAEPPRAESELIDKAGNIRLDNLNQPEDVDDALRQIARETSDFSEARFGDEGKKLHDSILAARKLTAQAAQEMADARLKAAAEDATDQHLLAYQESANRLTMIASRLATLTHSWGYAGQAFRMLEGIPDSARATSMAELAERTKGMTLFQLKQEAKLGLDLETVAQQNKFLLDARLTKWQKAKSMIVELFVNNLISGPITHLAYTIGNQSMNVFKATAETAAAATISTLRGAEAGERVYFGEIPAQFYGMIHGAPDGWAAARKAWKTGLAEPLPGALDALGATQREAFDARLPNQGAIPGRAGRIIRLPSDSVSAIHSFGSRVAYTQELYRLAYRDATDRGLTGQARDNAMARFLNDPPDAAMTQAREEGIRMVLMKPSEMNSAFSKFKGIVNNNLALKLIMPFMQIGANILREGFLERTPLGFADKAIRDNLLGRNGVEAQTIQAGKIAAGTALSTAAIGLTLNGTITGGGPSNPAERALLQTTGWQPYSIKMGDYWVPYRKYLGPLGTLIAGVSDVTEIAHHADDGDIAAAAKASVFGLSEVVADESWFMGASNFVDAARNWDKPQAERYFRNLATSFIPFSVGLSQTARLIDPYSRQVRDIVEAAQAKVPFASEGLMPRRDIFGEPIPSRLMVSPSQIKPDPVVDELEKMGKFIRTPDRKIRGIELSEKQYDDYSRISGRLLHLSLQNMFRTPGFSAMSAEIKGRIVDGAVSGAREQARSQIMMQSLGTHDDIVAKALAAKKAGLH